MKFLKSLLIILFLSSGFAADEFLKEDLNKTKSIPVSNQLYFLQEQLTDDISLLSNQFDLKNLPEELVSMIIGHVFENDLMSTANLLQVSENIRDLTIDVIKRACIKIGLTEKDIWDYRDNKKGNAIHGFKGNLSEHSYLNIFFHKTALNAIELTYLYKDDFTAFKEKNLAPDLKNSYEIIRLVHPDLHLVLSESLNSKTYNEKVDAFRKINEMLLKLDTQVGKGKVLRELAYIHSHLNFDNDPTDYTSGVQVLDHVNLNSYNFLIPLIYEGNFSLYNFLIDWWSVEHIKYTDGLPERHNHYMNFFTSFLKEINLTKNEMLRNCNTFILESLENKLSSLYKSRQAELIRLEKKLPKLYRIRQDGLSIIDSINNEIDDTNLKINDVIHTLNSLKVDKIVQL